MFMKARLSFLLLMLCFVSSIFAQFEPCDELYLGVFLNKYGHLRYTLSLNGTIEYPHVDSVSILKPIKDSVDEQGYTKYEVVQTYYDIQSCKNGASGDSIDISPLDRGYYSLRVYIQDCVKNRVFPARGSYPNTDTDPPVVYSCEEYEDIYVSVMKQDLIVTFDLSNDGTIEPPFVDSVGIAPIADTSNPIRIYYIQSGEQIDISFLDYGVYALLIYMGDCVKGGAFIIEKSTNVENNSALELVKKGKLFYNQGILYFRTPDGICYDMLGRSVFL